MKDAVHELAFDGALLTRGFWLYVWEITKPDSTRLYYVGRTGDSSSSNPQSPFNRMSAHLSFNRNNNILRRYLEGKQVKVELCSFRLLAHGPLLKGARSKYETRRDIIAALEKALADAMREAGYNVINVVYGRKPLDAKRFASVRSIFSGYFPAL
jgi:hypothetical protein